MFEVTRDEEMARKYLTKANFDYDAAVKMYMAAQFADGGTSERNPDETLKIQSLISVVGNERLAREFLVRANWDEAAATRLAVQELRRVKP
jgi:hypothetical protein